ncbi:MAG: GGDEF domain-containing protein, partial [Coriobacteriia bacterium]|nr:GGDEF domain-containing protein [Coriobacteriia bacterium]
MDRALMVVTAMEMLLVNLFVIHRCSQRKYGKLSTYVSMGLFVFALITIAYVISTHAPDFGGGNGLFIFSGFLFIIPIVLLYRVPLVKILTIACFTWVYTFIVFVLSVRLGYMIIITGWSITVTVLLFQTLFYLISFRAFYRLLQSRFVILIENIGDREAILFMWMTMGWLWLVFILNLSFGYPEIHIFKILTLITLSALILSCFWYIYLQVNSVKTIEDLESIAYRDELTQLRTRVILTKDAEDLISRLMPFHLIFFDLLDFKTINDRFGHLTGDKYLAFFAHEIKTRIGNHGGFYRLSGDEFICILPEEGLDAF